MRLSRILNDGKMLCIPMDHGITNGPISGLEDVYEFIYRCENSGVTSVIINKGIIKSLPRPPKVGIIAHLSASTSLGLWPNKKVQMGGVEDAIRLGADGISVHINIGAKEEPEMLQKLGIISDKCNEWNIPLIAMMYPRGENIKNPYDVGIVSHVARIGAEAGYHKQRHHQVITSTSKGRHYCPSVCQYVTWTFAKQEGTDGWSRGRNKIRS